VVGHWGVNGRDAATSIRLGLCKGPSFTRLSSPALLLRHLSFLVGLFVALAALPASAAEPPPPILCSPGQPPVPGCQLAPPGEPPPVSEAEIAAYRSRVLADFNARNGPQLYQRALERRDETRRQEWLLRAEAARPGDIPVRFPTVEAIAGFRVGTVARKSYGHAGPEVGFAFRFNRHFGFEIPIALMQTWSGSLGHWATIASSPAFVASYVTKDSIVYARGGPDILVPRGASGMAPNTMIGGHLGFGTLFFVATLPNYGHVALGFDLRGALRGGAGGPDSLLDTPRFGIDGTVVIRLAY